MSCCSCVSATPKELERQERLHPHATKLNIAIFGTGCSGKKSICRQLQSINKDSYDNRHGQIVYENIIRSIFLLCQIILANNDSYYKTLQEQITHVQLIQESVTFRDATVPQDRQIVIKSILKVANEWIGYFGLGENIHIAQMEVNYSPARETIGYVSKDTLESYKIAFYCDEMQYALKKNKHLYPFLEHIEYFITRIDAIFYDFYLKQQNRYNGMNIVNNNDIEVMMCDTTFEDLLKSYSTMGGVLRIDINNPISDRDKKQKDNAWQAMRDAENNHEKREAILARLDLAKWKPSKSTVWCASGHTTERNRYWIHAADACGIVLYVVALDQYCKQPYVI